MKEKKFKKYLFSVLGILVFLSVIFYFFIYIPRQKSIEEGSDLIDVANALVDDLEYFEAEEKFNEVEEIDPGNYRSYHGLAEIYLMKNRTENAIEILQIGVTNSRNKSELNEMLGKIYLDDGDYSRAIHFLEKSVSQDSSNYEAKFLLSQSYVGTGDFEKALKYLDLSEDDNGLDFELYVKAMLLKSMLFDDDVSESKDLMDGLDLTEVDDDIADQVELYKEVLSDIDLLDEESRIDVYVSVMVSRSALYSGYPDLVIGLLSEYADEYALYWELNLYLGHAYLIKNDYEKSLEYLAEAYILETNSSIGSRLLARSHLGNDDDTEMIKYYEKAINLSSGEEKLETRIEFFKVLISKEQFARAEEQLDYILINDGVDTDEMLLTWGDSLLIRESYSQLKDIIGDIKLNNLDDDLKGRYYYLESGISYGNADWTDAEESIVKAIAMNDGMAQYHLLYGRILYQTSNDADALVELEKSVELDLEGEVSIEAQKVLDRI